MGGCMAREELLVARWVSLAGRWNVASLHEIFCCCFFLFSGRTSQAFHLPSTAGVCVITAAWCKEMGEKVSTGGSWQTLFKPLEKCDRLTPQPSLLIMSLVELVSIPASHFYNHLITAFIEYSWNSPLQLMLWKHSVDYKKAENIK